MGKLQVKAMIFLFNIRGVIMIKWVPEGQNATQKYYFKVLTTLQEQTRNRTQFWKIKSWILQLHLVHNALAMKQFLVTKYIPVLAPPPPFTRFSPCNLYLFSRVKNMLKGTHSQTVNEVR